MTPIAHYEDRYEITPYGEVINLANNKPLTPTKNPNGYLKVGLANGDGTLKQVSVHRLVATHFLANPYGHPQVNHKNGNKEDNSVHNLEWVSVTENAQHALKTKLRPGYMSMNEKLNLVARVIGGELIADLAVETARPETGLSGMLRKAADASGQRPAWDEEMQRRRKNVAIRNLEKINNKHP